MQKLYCYVDESGQNTLGNTFAVGVFVVEGTEKREVIRKILEIIENASGKRRQKWRTSKHTERVEYFTTLFSNPIFSGGLHYSTYHSTRDYVSLTVMTVAETIVGFASHEYSATILVDGLRSNEEHKFASSLRKQGIRTKKVRGLKDENDAFIRLVDALAGLVIDADQGNTVYRNVLEKAIQEGYVTALRQ